MGYFPFFMDIKGKSGLIVGGGRVAARKAEKLTPFEPDLTVVAPVILQELLEDPSLVCEKREFADSDVEGKMFVIAASGDRGLNSHVAELCRERGILVNVVDDRKECGFLFPSLIREGKLTVGISTEGASPQVAAFLRSRAKQELCGNMEEILDFLSQLRSHAREKIPDSGKRAAFLKDAALLCMEKERPLSGDEIDGLLTSEPLGSVTLVGAGCGACDLITVRGLNAVRRAQVLVYDDLMDEGLLAHASESCEKIYVGKRRGRHSMGQEEINALLIEKAGQGKRVVRLKGGDPFVFGRGGEEILALKAEGIQVSAVPGITSSIAVPGAAGIPVTQRGMSRSFHVIAGHAAQDGDGLWEDLEALSTLHGTLVFLMGFHHLEEIAQRLMGYGKDPRTPAAVLHGEFDGNVQAVRGTLGDIADKVKAAGLETPAVIVVGETAGLELL